jgi:hypothetical protein
MPTLGYQADRTGKNGLVEPMLDMGVPVIVALEDSSGIDLVPVNSVVGVEDFVGFDPLVVDGPSLGHNPNPLELHGGANFNPFVRIDVVNWIPRQRLGVQQNVCADSPIIEGDRRGNWLHTHSDGITIQFLLIL